MRQPANQVSDVFRQGRKRAGMGLLDASKALRCSSQKLLRVEQGRAQPTVALCDAAASAYGLDENELVVILDLAISDSLEVFLGD